MTTERLLSRREAVDLIRAQYGLPISISSFQTGRKKLCPQPADGCEKRPPKPHIRFGMRWLYKPADIHAFAARLLSVS